MPSDGPDPNNTHADGVPGTSRDRSNEVALGNLAHDGTLEQHGTPSWVQKASGVSEASRSGKAVHELDREIERHQTAGGEDLADGYNLLRKLGTGSFGAVWEAEDRLTGERVAIKFFTAGDSDWEKLLSEVGLLQAVEGCRGIVIVKQVRPGINGRHPLYVMQLANGGSLADWIKTASAIPPRERTRLATEFFTRVARAMAAVHRRGIHHCDLKPQNILLHSPEPGAVPDPLVADFGQGHLATDDTPALGTFFYMPLDQIDAAQTRTPPDTRWDVYALGAVVYEMLTSEPPRRSLELVEKIKKAPKVLATKMAVYREGVLAAPRPVAHHKVVDRSLARIIDRCLSLNPDTRPRDAGALVALLDARARWLRTRPVLTLAAFATLLVVGLIAAIGVTLANMETRRQEEYVTDEVKSCLTRTAGYGARAVEDRLQRHVISLEAYAEQTHEKYPDVVDALVRARKNSYGPKNEWPVLDDKGQKAVRDWLTTLQRPRQRRAGDGHLPTLGLMLVSEPDAAGKSRGFYAARIHGNGSPEGRFEELANTTERDFFSADLSYRDYFHEGGELEAEKHLPHAVIRRSHISQPFRSRGTDMIGGAEVRQRWKLNIAAPVWDDPKAPTRRALGLIILGLDIERDLESLVHPPEFTGGGESEQIAEAVQVVLIDDRHRWVWHPDCKAGVLARSDGGTGDRLPHNYRQLAIDRRLNPEDACPWLRVPRKTYETPDTYVDLVESRIYHRDRNGSDQKEIACFTSFNPYRLSDYEKSAPGSRQWVFVAQVEQKRALAPLRTLEHRLVTIGAGAGAALVLLALVLWAWLFRVLRRLEFASHG